MPNETRTQETIMILQYRHIKPTLVSIALTKKANKITIFRRWELDIFPLKVRQRFEMLILTEN